MAIRSRFPISRGHKAIGHRPHPVPRSVYRNYNALDIRFAAITHETDHAVGGRACPRAPCAVERALVARLEIGGVLPLVPLGPNSTTLRLYTRGPDATVYSVLLECFSHGLIYTRHKRRPLGPLSRCAVWAGAGPGGASCGGGGGLSPCAVSVRVAGCALLVCEGRV